MNKSMFENEHNNKTPENLVVDNQSIKLLARPSPNRWVKTKA